MVLTILTTDKCVVKKSHNWKSYNSKRTVLVPGTSNYQHFTVFVSTHVKVKFNFFSTHNEDGLHKKWSEFTKWPLMTCCVTDTQEGTKLYGPWQWFIT